MSDQVSFKVKMRSTQHESGTLATRSAKAKTGVIKRSIWVRDGDQPI